MEEKESFVIFDGECGFCDSSVLWIAKHDTSNHFLLVSNSSIFGRELLKKYDLEAVSSHSIILIDQKGAVTLKSRAIQKIMESIHGYSFFKFLMKVTPRFFQNIIYDLIAHFRKYIPTKKVCEMADEELSRKFKL